MHTRRGRLLWGWWWPVRRKLVLIRLQRQSRKLWIALCIFITVHGGKYGCDMPRIPQVIDNRSQMAVRLPASRSGRSLPPRRFVVLISVRSWVDPRTILRLQALGQLKKCNDLIGTRTQDLPVCSVLLQPTTLPRSPICPAFALYAKKNILVLVLPFGTSQPTSYNSLW
jgi:hypothetical protein